MKLKKINLKNDDTEEDIEVKTGSLKDLKDGTYFIGDYKRVKKQRHVCPSSIVFRRKYDKIKEPYTENIVTCYDPQNKNNKYAFRPIELKCSKCTDTKIVHWGYLI